MNKPHILGVIACIVLLVFAGCHKDSSGNTNGLTPISGTSPGGVGPTIPAGAAGALYAVNDNVIVNYGGGGGADTQTTGFAFAWFVDDTTTYNAGSVVANGDSLYTTDPLVGFTWPWYELSLSTPISYTSNPVIWGVQGNSSSGVPGFNYTDNTAFPVVNGLSLPSVVSISSSLTVNFSVTGAYDYIFYTISGQGQSSLSFLGKSGTTATFTSSQLSQVVSSGGSLAVQVMPVKLNQQTISGKTYYFVKQNAFAVSALVQ